MPYEIVADKIAKISPEYQGELLQFIDFLLYKQGNSSEIAIVTTQVGGPPRSVIRGESPENFTWQTTSTSLLKNSRSTCDVPSRPVDPFDRLIVATAQAKGLTIITRDLTIPKYPVKTLW